MMKDHEDEQLMREAVRTYHVPPEPPLEEMWRRIEARRIGTAGFVAGIPYEVATRRYLGQTAALLLALPLTVPAGGADARFAAQAQELLSTTRLLLDSPAAADPTMRGLLEDLELVLAQIARLRSTQGEAELDFITSTLEQRDVLPRLGSVAADVASSDN